MSNKSREGRNLGRKKEDQEAALSLWGQHFGRKKTDQEAALFLRDNTSLKKTKAIERVP
ncbi:hypothetical protein [uncultured Arcticibacterium sp.]|uniref:hypothetical protein n=1 Tax=uncultured Arcticibacterium sp. TaxID=2173042 RepID=UPI0030FAB981